MDIEKAKAQDLSRPEKAKPKGPTDTEKAKGPKIKRPKC